MVDDGAVRSAAWAAMGLSTLAVAVCVITVPILSGRLDDWQLDVKLKMQKFKALTDDSWRQMMEVRNASPQLDQQVRRAVRQAKDVQVLSRIRSDAQGEWIFIPNRRPTQLDRGARSRPAGDYAGAGAADRPQPQRYSAPDPRPKPAYTQPERDDYAGGRDAGGDDGYRQTPAPAPAADYGPRTSAPDTGGYGQGDQGDSSCEDSRGPPGAPGQPGRDGEPGSNGEDGQPGLPGPDVQPDVIEWPCITCPQGLPGPAGPRGPPGQGGKKGLSGQGGVPGRPGANGFMGPKGASGPKGDKGKSGRRGLPGLDTLGGKGQPGSKGASGARGPHGERGTPGRKITYGGSPGPQGIRGVNGQPGQSGTPGRDGRPGNPGTPGKDGEYCPCPPKNDQAGYPSAPDGLQYEEQGGGQYPAPADDQYGPAQPPAAVNDQYNNGGRPAPADQYADRPSGGDPAYLSPWQQKA